MSGVTYAGRLARIATLKAEVDRLGWRGSVCQLPQAQVECWCCGKMADTAGVVYGAQVGGCCIWHIVPAPDAMTEDGLRQHISALADLYATRAGSSGVTAWGRAHGVSRSHLSEFMAGKRGPTGDVLDALDLEWRIVRRRASPPVLALTQQGETTPVSGDEVWQRARVAFVLETASIEHDTRLADLTPDEIDSICHAVVTAAALHPTDQQAIRREALEEADVERVARAICKTRVGNPDCLYQHDFEGDWPEDERREYSDPFTGEPRVQLFHRAWRRWEEAARAAIRALMSAPEKEGGR